jgi:DNA repair protein RecN (Recombination protein N)
MLKHFSIDQFVIIDHLALDFRRGLTVLTGETGAGKSILLDGMGLILGEEADRESMRAGANTSTFKAAFHLPKGHPVWAFLANQKIKADPADDIDVERVIGRDGSDVIRVNSTDVPLDALRDMGNLLVEIHGQFANQNLLDPMKQLLLLDAYGAYPPEILGNVARDYHDILRYQKELDEEHSFIARHGHEQAIIEKDLTELTRLGMREGFYEEVQAELHRLINIRETNEIFQSVQAQLVASIGAEPALSIASKTVARQKDLDGDVLEPLEQFINTALANVRKAIAEMTRLMPQYDQDTSNIKKLEATTEALHRIARDRQIDPPNKLFEFFEAQQAKLKRIKNSRALILKLDEQLAKAKISYVANAHILTNARVKAARNLSQAITAEMPPLKLLRAAFEVEVLENINKPWTAIGINDVTFTARTNPGMPFSPIAKTASGGELARMVLALKVVVQSVLTTCTLVFDEIDTGIGGAAAAAVGERLAQLADTTQVLVITHSPQVAARGQQHLHVSKKTDGVTTETIVVTLGEQERIDEISRMLAGDVITAEARAAALSLINEAEAAARVRGQPKEKAAV